MSIDIISDINTNSIKIEYILFKIRTKKTLQSKVIINQNMPIFLSKIHNAIHLVCQYVKKYPPKI